jgi:WD40 repeat protein
MPRPEVFLSHAGADKESVKAIARRLNESSIPTWLDEWNLIPGDSWVDALGQALKKCSGCAVFLGPGGEAPWQHEEILSALNRAVRDRSFRVVPVLLPGTPRERLSHLPEFLANRHGVEFTKGLDDPDAFHRLVCGLLGIEPGTRADTTYTPGPNPYRGLRTFDVGHAELFLGREVLTRQLLTMLDREPRFVSIVGPSGSGKSSLARAGLLASLRGGGLPGSAEWPQAIIRPGAFPLESLAIGIASKLAPANDPSELIRRFGAGEEALHREVRMALQGRPELRAVLLVDQAEEAFTLGARDEDRAAFFANLVYAATVRMGQTVVVLALRADFYPRFAEHRQLAALVPANQLLVPPMSEDELRRAIALPAERRGRPLRPALVDELLGDARGRPGSLPLLEHALAQLWERPEPVLGVEEYLSIGGLAGAINGRAEAIFASLTAPQQAACRRLFLRLVQQGEGTVDTRRRVRGAELPFDQREVSQAFAAEGVHLLTWSSEGGQEFLEVAHEELIRRWDRLQQWARADQDGQRTHRRLTAAVDEWGARAPDNRDESFLYRGAVLAAVEEWFARLPDDERVHVLNPEEIAFLEQSRAARDRARLEQERRTREAEELAEKREALRAAEQQRRRDAETSSRRVRTWLVAALAMAALASGAAVIAIINGTKVTRVQAIELSRELTTVVRANLEGDPQLNLALLKQARRLAETEELYQALAQWANIPRRGELRGHSGPLESAAFSPDGLRIITASDDHTARLWDATTGKPLAVLSAHSGPVRSAVFSRDGLRIVTASVDGTVRIWDAASGKSLVILSGHSSWVRSAVFSPDGLRIVTASVDGTARVWDAASGTLLATLSAHSYLVASAVFSPDGLRIITAGSDKTARLWDVITGKHLATLSGHTGSVWSAAYSPDGTRVVTASDDTTAQLWDAVTGKHLATLSGHTGSVWSATFSSDGLRLVTASDDTTAQLWEVSTGKRLATLSGHTRAVWHAAFSPDGLRLVTVSDDNTARLWDGVTGKPLAVLSGHSGPVWRAAFSPDGLSLVTASDDHTAQLWDATANKLFATLSGHSGPVRSAAFSPDGLRIITASDDTTARLWDTASGKTLAILSRHAGEVESAAFSPDSLRIITADGETARLWDTASGKSLGILSGHSGRVRSAAFSANSLRVVTVSDDDTARLYDAVSGKLLAILPRQSGGVESAAFSPDGLRIITANDDTTARLWDAVSGNPLVVRPGYPRKVDGPALTPDDLLGGKANDDSVLRHWTLDDGEAATQTFDLYRHSSLKGFNWGVSYSDLRPLWRVAFRSDGLRVITANHNKARLWDGLTSEPLATLSGHSALVRSVAFSPDGLRAVTASEDRTARIWDMTTGKPLFILSGHSGPVKRAIFSPDGLHLVTASEDGTARVWDAVTGKALVTLSGHSGPVESAAFSPNGLRIVTASEDGTALVWQNLLWAPRSEQVEVLNSGRELTPEERRAYLHE